MFTTKDVVRLSDRWFDPRHPDAISRQSRLQSCVVLVTVFHLVMSIAFAKIDEYERAHPPRRVVPSEYSFEFMIAPPELKHVMSIPKPITLIDGKDQNIGGMAGVKQGEQKAAAPVLKEDSIAQKVEKVAISDPQPVRKLITQPTDIPSMNPLPIKSQEEPVSSPAGEQVNAEADPAARGIASDGAGEIDHGDGSYEGQDGEQEGYGDDSQPSQSTPFRTRNGSSSDVRVNIAPYRKQMLIKLSQQWEAPTKKAVRLLLLIDIANDGSLVSAAVVGSSGNKKVDREALAAVHRTTFEPFPEDIAAVLKHCRFQIDLRNF